jgi:NAD(P)H-dependent FMN reductase
MNNTLKLQIIMGSTRQGRFSDKVAKWLEKEANDLDGLSAESIDLRDWPLPFYDEIAGPAQLDGKYSVEIAKKWAAKINEADGYIIVTPEYNHGTSAVLKNALDYAYKEWNKKPVAFVSYGGMGGARAIEQLRLQVIALDMVPIRTAINIPGAKFFPILQGKSKWEPQNDQSLQRSSSGLLKDMSWWMEVLNSARKN